MVVFWMSLEPQYQWLIIAVLFAIAELIVPGVFLIWLAAAAAMTGMIMLVVDVPVPLQFLLFGAFAIASTWFGRRWYLKSETPSADPLLNDRSARLIGQTVTVVDPVSSNGGRVKVGDGEWPARGPTLKKGTIGRIVAVNAGVLQIEPVEPQ